MNTEDMNNNNINNNYNNGMNNNFNNNVPPKKKKKGGIANIIPYIFILGILVVVGMLVFPKFFFGEENPTNNTVEPSEPTEPAEPVTPVVPQKKVTVVDLESKTRPVGIMINCHSEALPQSGLQDAYAVYELMVEGGITRMFALFKDKDFTKVGAVRSVRAQYLGYAFENDAIIIHAGGSAEATNRMANEGIANISVDGKYGQRDMQLAKKRAWEHTLFTKWSSVSQAIKDRGLRSTTDTTPVLNYSAEEVDMSKYTTKKDANNVSIRYSNYRTSNYYYDADKKVYLRSMNGTKNVDLVTGQRYEVKNIIVYGVKYSNYCDHGYCGYVKPANIGNGEGWYITDGVALPIKWSKKDEKSKTEYRVKETGEELKVNDGNTYFQIYPTNGGSLKIT